MTTSADYKCETSAGALTYSTGRRHNLTLGNLSVTEVTGPDEVRPGQGNVVFIARVNIADPSAAQLSRIRWRVHSGGAMIVDTAPQGDRLTLRLPSDLRGDTVVARAYINMPSKRPFKVSRIHGRTGAGGLLTSAEQLAQVMEAPLTARMREFYRELSGMFPRYGLTSHLRQAHFLAQVKVETGGLRAVSEIAPHGDVTYFDKYAATSGNRSVVDARAFRGRGVLQLTGYDTYNAFFRAVLRRSLTRAQLQKEAPRVADDLHLVVEASGYFWRDFKNIHEFADNDDGFMVSVLVNGFTAGQRWFPNHYHERVAAFLRTRTVLGRR